MNLLGSIAEIMARVALFPVNAANNLIGSETFAELVEVTQRGVNNFNNQIRTGYDDLRDYCVSYLNGNQHRLQESRSRGVSNLSPHNNQRDPLSLSLPNDSPNGSPAVPHNSPAQSESSSEGSESPFLQNLEPVGEFENISLLENREGWLNKESHRRKKGNVGKGYP